MSVVVMVDFDRNTALFEVSGCLTQLNWQVLPPLVERVQRAMDAVITLNFSRVRHCEPEGIASLRAAAQDAMHSAGRSWQMIFAAPGQQPPCRGAA